MKTLIVCYSYHHNNTQKIAEVMVKVLNAEIKTPKQANLQELVFPRILNRTYPTMWVSFVGGLIG